MSQADVARASKGGVTLSHLGLIETGERSASVDKVDAIANALKLSAKERADLQAARKATSGEPDPEPDDEPLAASRDRTVPVDRDELRRMRDLINQLLDEGDGDE